MATNKWLICEPENPMFCSICLKAGEKNAFTSGCSNYKASALKPHSALGFLFSFNLFFLLSTCHDQCRPVSLMSWHTVAEQSLSLSPTQYYFFCLLSTYHDQFRPVSLMSWHTVAEQLLSLSSPYYFFVCSQPAMTVNLFKCLFDE